MNTSIAYNTNNQAIDLTLKMSNRHGLIAGATGTGKTVTLRKMAETFSAQGVPVFMVDVKGDLSGIARAGEATGFVAQRMTQYGLDNSYLQHFPVRFWDIYGETGIPVRVSISEMGPILLARLMNLNATQEGLLNLVFRVADDKGWHVIDLKDLRALLHFVAEHAAEYRTKYGHISATSIGAIQRQLLQLESEGAVHFFGQPELDLNDWLVRDPSGKGMINILNSEKLMRSPRVYGAFLLWFLAQLFETLPEVGDVPQPKLVLFFDEAHLIFDQANPELIQQVEQVVRLIRSKGVGVYFVTQNPLDLPDSVLAQLGNRVQHALRAFTPKEQKSVRTVAQTFRANPEVDVAQVITELGVGEALVSFLDDKGQPEVVQRAHIMPPQSQLSPLSAEQRDSMFRQDALYARYRDAVDRFSAYEALQGAQNLQAAESSKPTSGALNGFLGGLLGGRKKSGQGVVYDVADQVGSQINRQVMRMVSRAVMNAIKKWLK